MTGVDPSAEPDAGPATGPVADEAPAAGGPAPAEALTDSVDAMSTEPEPAGDVVIDVELLVADLERVSTERDDYLDRLRRLQAEFENYRKAVAKREADAKERANDHIVGELLPIIDACDGAVANGADDVVPVRASMLEGLGRLGLERVEPAGEPFDPEQHDAVMHEDVADVDVPTVAEVLRVGYRWNGRVLRPAMVKTVG